MIRLRLILRVLGALLLIIGISMLPAWLIAFYNGVGEQATFLYPLLGSVLLGSVFFFSFPSTKGLEISHREGFLIVTLGWVVVALAAALPFYLFGLTSAGAKFFPSFASAYFESMSGLTTTGGTILPSMEDLPKSMLFWRSMSHWLGGMGIILLGLAILPFLGIGGLQLYKAEVPGPKADKLRPRIKETAKSLWRVYIILTAAEIVFLLFGGMSFFDSICHSFATVATGGFSTKNISVEGFNSFYIEMVILVFMFLAGMNFALHFFSLKGKFRSVWKNEEFRFYTSVVVLWSVMIAGFLTYSGYYNGFWTALRYSSFQVVSLMTSTGFSSCNFDDWWVDAVGKGAHVSMIVMNLLLILMIVGGSVGSTGGGIKCMRAWLMIKFAYRELLRLIHPRLIRPIKLDSRSVQEDVLFAIFGFLALYFILGGLATLFLAAYGIDFMTSFSAVIACIGNIGPGVAKVGPYQNFAFMPDPVKWVLSFCMLLGRLELYTVIVLFLPGFWKK